MSPLLRQYKKLQCSLQEVTAHVLTPQLNIIYKDNANEWQKSLLLVARVQLVLYKDNANERNGKTGKRSFTGLDTAVPKLVLYKDYANERQKSLLLVARVQLVLYKDYARRAQWQGGETQFYRT